MAAANFSLKVSQMTTIDMKQGCAPIQCKAKQSHRILVVEDDVIIRHINTNVLIKSGYEVDAAEDEAAAWEALQLKGYDLLVTDNDMPNVSGVELLKKLHAASNAMPVIMVSGKMPTEELNRQPWLKIKAALHKPYMASELAEKVRNVLFPNDGTLVEIAPQAI
jgi:DNA-binding response OmpR family regulator